MKTAAQVDTVIVTEHGSLSAPREAATCARIIAHEVELSFCRDVMRSLRLVGCFEGGTTRKLKPEAQKDGETREG